MLVVFFRLKLASIQARVYFRGKVIPNV